MTREDLDFIGSMNMCDEISNEAYKKIVCHCEEQEHIFDKIIEDIQTLRGCSCWCSDGIIDDVEDIIDKYRAESEDKE